MECTLIKFAYDNKLGAPVDVLETAGCKNGLIETFKIQKEQVQSIQPVKWHSMEMPGWEAAQWTKPLVALVGSELSSHLQRPWQQQGLTASWAVSGGAQINGKDYPSLISTCVSSSRLVVPILGLK